MACLWHQYICKSYEGSSKTLSVMLSCRSRLKYNLYVYHVTQLKWSKSNWAKNNTRLCVIFPPCSHSKVFSWVGICRFYFLHVSCGETLAFFYSYNINKLSFCFVLLSEACERNTNHCSALVQMHLHTRTETHTPYPQSSSKQRR